MSVDRGMDKEATLHVYTGILLSHEKEWNHATTEQLHFHFSLSCTGGGNCNPLQCSCLENPRDGGAWWAAVYGVAQSWTRLKWLSSSSNATYSNMDGPSLILSEVSQTEKEKCLWHRLYLESKKGYKWTYLQTEVDSPTQKTNLRLQKEKGGEGLNEGSRINRYTWLYIK